MIILHKKNINCEGLIDYKVLCYDDKPMILMNKYDNDLYYLRFTNFVRIKNIMLQLIDILIQR